MSVVELFILAVGLSMDAFAVAICKGLCMRKVTIKKAGIVGLYFGLFQAGMPMIGYILGSQFSDKISSIDHWIAFILLGIIGGKMLIESIKEIRGGEKELALECERDEFSYKKLTILAIATSIDALAVGVSFAFLSVSIVPSVIIIGITTFVLSFFAVFLGKKLGEYVQNYAEIIGGVILIGIGIKILFEHLM